MFDNIAYILSSWIMKKYNEVLFFWFVNNNNNNNEQIDQSHQKPQLRIWTREDKNLNYTVILEATIRKECIENE